MEDRCPFNTLEVFEQHWNSLFFKTLVKFLFKTICTWCPFSDDSSLTIIFIFL